MEDSTGDEVLTAQFMPWRDATGCRLQATGF